MSTLLDVLQRSMTAIGQLGRGQTLSPEDKDLGLAEANILLQQKSTQRLFLPYVAIRSYILQNNVADYTIGPSGLFTGTRPVLIESAQIKPVSSGIWIPISVWDKPKWDAIITKSSIAEIPQGVYPEYTYPNLAFHVNPIPNTTPQIQFGAWEVLQQFTSVFDTLALPPAYESWLEASLNIILAPMYDQPVPQALIDRRTDALGDLQRYNSQPMGGAVSPAQQLQSPNVGQPIPAGQ